ncbi:hypothetical protein ACSSS7_003520 [Eimeria intestinalis]
MAHTEMVVAGVPSDRLSQLASPQLAPRHHRREPLFPAHAASTGGMTAVLRPTTDFEKNKKCTSFSHSMDALGYAGKPTCRINGSIYEHGIKKQSGEANRSNQMTALFCNDGQQPKCVNQAARRMKDYCSPDRLSDAFCTRFQVTDPLTGRTEIMTARKPGRATTEINVSEFDGYMMPKERTYSIKKAQDNIDQNILVGSHIQVSECFLSWETPMIPFSRSHSTTSIADVTACAQPPMVRKNGTKRKEIVLLQVRFDFGSLTGSDAKA